MRSAASFPQRRGGNAAARRHNGQFLNRPMRIRSALFVLPFLFAAACSSDHPLAGNWAQVTGTPTKGVQLGFEIDGKRVSVHGPTRPDGGHGHPSTEVTYTFDAATKVVTVTGDVMVDGKSATWTGPLAGDSLELTSGATTLKFQRGGSAH
jgi:uncharacterized Zn-binding protein involved in type VI secretion